MRRYLRGVVDGFFVTTLLTIVIRAYLEQVATLEDLKNQLQAFGDAMREVITTTTGRGEHQP